MKTLLKTSAIALACASAANGQGLFDLASLESERDTLPLRWSLSANVGYDDNVNPLSIVEDESLYVAAYLGATFFNRSPQTTLDVNGRVGYIHYLDEILGGGEDGTPSGNLGVNWNHRISERLRLSSKNGVTFGREPNYAYGFSGSQGAGEYLYFQTDNSIGYKWTERFATYSGFAYNILRFDDITNADRDSFALYTQGRYQLNQRTVLTGEYRFSQFTGDGGVTDSTNHMLLFGVEHRLSPQSLVVFKAGAQFRDVDGGENSTSPYFEGALNTRVNESLSVRAYARYSVEDYARNLGPVVYSGSNTLRIGASARYAVSPRLALNAGGNLIFYGYEDSQNVVAADIDESLLNLYLGADFQVMDNLSLSATYNFDTYESDLNLRDYDRNRFNLGVNYLF